MEKIDNKIAMLNDEKNQVTSQQKELIEIITKNKDIKEELTFKVKELELEINHKNQK